MSIILTIIGIILFFGGIIAGCSLKQYEIEEKGNEKAKFPKGFVIVVLVGLIVFGVGNSLVIIPTGYTGVKSTFGQIWSETSERTALYYDGITVTYQINPEMSAWIYANVSNYKENLVTQTLVASAIKTSSKSLTSTDATNRGIVEPLSMQNIQKALDEKYGEDVVIINKVVIANTDFEDSYNQAIAEKQTAQLAYEQQQIENQKKIEAAEADAKVKTTQAQGEADAAVIKAQGEADANKLLNDSLTNKILQQMYLEKWDGALPKVSLSDGADTIVDIGDLSSTTEVQSNE